MHPQRAARLLASLGSFFFVVVLILRLYSMAGTNVQRAVQKPAAAKDTPAPAVGRYHISGDGAQLLFEQQIDRTSASAWFRMPLEGGEITPAQAPVEDPRPFIIRNERLVTINSDSDIQSPPPTRVISYQLSPDHQAIAYAGIPPTGLLGLYVMDIPGKVVWLGDQDGLADIAWSADNRYLAFTANQDGLRQVFVIDREGQTLRQLTTDAAPKRSPVWSPDGQTIAYLVEVSSPTGPNLGLATATPVPLYVPTPGSFDASPVLFQIKLIQLEGPNLRPAGSRPLTRQPLPIFDLAWINAGKELAYAQRQANQPQVTDLYALDPASGKTRRVYPPYAITALDCPAAVERDGTAQVRLTVKNENRLPADVPVLERSGPTAFERDGSRSAGLIHAGTIQIPAGQSGSITWTVPAAAGLVTHVSALINIGQTIPMDETSCVIQNTYYGLPNLSFLPLSGALTLVGMLLFLPWLRNQKRVRLWAAWGMVPVDLILLIALEAWMAHL